MSSSYFSQLGGDIDGEAAYDHSGFAVSLSSDGSVVAIGAIFNDGNGNDSGHVRIYQNISGTWTQIGDDIDGEAANDYSGQSVSLSSDGSVVAIGADYNDGNLTSIGHVRIYQNVSGTWIQIGDDIDGEAEGDYSGYSVSLSSDGSVIAIGADYNDGNGTRSGHVRIYQNVSGTWTQIGDDIDGEATGDFSGTSVSLSSDGSIVAIGADYNDGNGTHSGHVRIYQNVSGTWTQIGDDIDGEATGDFSGSSVSLSSDGSVVAIGAFGNDGNGDGSGHTRIYQYSNGFSNPFDISSHQVGTSYHLEYIRDYDGNLHANTGSVSDELKNSYKYQGRLDVNNDGVLEAIYTNKVSGRWVTGKIDTITGEIDYSDHGENGGTRVVGIYDDPLIAVGNANGGFLHDGVTPAPAQFGATGSDRYLVVNGETIDRLALNSQVRFQNDLYNDNLTLKTSGDYDGDGYQEVYWKTNYVDVYLRSLIHADGNIQYANYQNQNQMSDYLTGHGYQSVISEII